MILKPKITTPHPFQANLITEVIRRWDSGEQYVLGVAPTGAGKTVIKAFTAKHFADKDQVVVIFAHRDVLLSQISMTLAKCGIPHQLICSAATEKDITNSHVDEFGFTYCAPKAKVYVASVLTWVNRDISRLAPLVKCWMLDEAHHLTIGTSWHRVVDSLPNAKGLGVTATPLRADNKGLGRDFGGVFESIVEAPDMGELMDMGYLSRYRIYSIASKLDEVQLPVTASGDYSQKKLAAVTEEADIVGSAVGHYLKHGEGGQAITFVPSISYAKVVEKEFNDAGIPSVALSSKDPLSYRNKKIKEFKKGKITNVINVDLFGEGFDVPACSVVIMLRKTASYGLFKQMFGRMLRVFDGKPYGVLIDHVGNAGVHCVHGAPHDDPEWSLEPEIRKKKKKNAADIDEVTCSECGLDYMPLTNSEEDKVCPKTHGGCGHKELPPPPELRTCSECCLSYTPASNDPKDFICPVNVGGCGHLETEDDNDRTVKKLQIREGTLVEWDNSYLHGIMQERANVDRSIEQVKNKLHGQPHMVMQGVVNRHLKRKEAQRELREWITAWCLKFFVKHKIGVETTQNEFLRYFGVDVFKAQTLGERKANELTDKIKRNWSEL